MIRTILQSLPAILLLGNLAGADTLQLSFRGQAIAPIVLGAKSSIENFYSYGIPNYSSSNTGLEASQSMTLVPVVQADGVAGLIILLDQVDDGSGGEVDFLIHGLKGAAMIVEDDAEFTSGDRYAYNPYSAEAHLHCMWWACCTDGTAFRFEEEIASLLEFDFLGVDGLDHARIAGLDPMNGEAFILDNLPLSFTLSLDFLPDVPEDDSEEETPLNANSMLQPATPNPFNPGTTIQYSLPAPGWARVEIHDILGRLVSVVEEGYMKAGSHSSYFDASGLASGNYYLSLSTSAGHETQQITLLK